MEHIELPYSKLFHIPNFLSPVECDQLIKRCDDIGWEKALITRKGEQVLDEDVRKTSRCMIDDIPVAQQWYDRLLPHLSEICQILDLEEPTCGLNERLRVLKYDPTDYFRYHYDGCYERKDGSEEFSMLTLQIYLNEGFVGGETSFVAEYDAMNLYEHKPKLGSAVIFLHDLLHCGREVTDGQKFVVRTDVMFKSL
jgi:prolyl 4-hydroxylase